MTTIEWTNDSWNPLRARDLGPVGTGPGPGWHCEIISPGCERCYSQSINKRRGTHRPYIKTARPRVHVYLDEKILTKPLRWKRPRRIFVCSMSDLFGEWVPDEMIDRIFAVMALCPQHTFQVLTKRHDRMRHYVTDGLDGVEIERWRMAGPLPALERNWPLPNVWLGVSVEDQRRANERIPALLDTPAVVRWLSVEPQLELIELPWLKWWRPGGKSIRWVVVGGESGPGARPFSVEWARSIIAQCKAAGVACFVKQLGARPVGTCCSVDIPLRGLSIRDRKGGDPIEWPDDLRVREYPE